MDCVVVDCKTGNDGEGCNLKSGLPYCGNGRNFDSENVETLQTMLVPYSKNLPSQLEGMEQGWIVQRREIDFDELVRCRTWRKIAAIAEDLGKPMA